MVACSRTTRGCGGPLVLYSRIIKLCARSWVAPSAGGAVCWLQMLLRIPEDSPTTDQGVHMIEHGTGPTFGTRPQSPLRRLLPPLAASAPSADTAADCTAVSADRRRASSLSRAASRTCGRRHSSGRVSGECASAAASLRLVPAVTAAEFAPAGPSLALHPRPPSAQGSEVGPPRGLQHALPSPRVPGENFITQNVSGHCRCFQTREKPPYPLQRAH